MMIDAIVQKTLLVTTIVNNNDEIVLVQKILGQSVAIRPITNHEVI